VKLNLQKKIGENLRKKWKNRWKGVFILVVVICYVLSVGKLHVKLAGKTCAKPVYVKFIQIKNAFIQFVSIAINQLKILKFSVCYVILALCVINMIAKDSRWGAVMSTVLI
jgi:hypothetical protein